MKNLVRNMYNREFFGADVIQRNAILIKFALGILALFASAQIAIPIKPVPITMHTVMVSFIGLTYSPRLSFATVGTYITLGMIGAPIFAHFQSGPGVSSGYLVAMIIAAPVMSMIRSKFGDKLLVIIAACFIAHVIIYVLGVSWLATYFGWEKAIQFGFIVYIPVCIVKILIFSLLFSYVRKG